MNRNDAYGRLAGVAREFWPVTEPESPSFGHRMAAKAFTSAKWAWIFLLSTPLTVVLIGVLNLLGLPANSPLILPIFTFPGVCSLACSFCAVVCGLLAVLSMATRRSFRGVLPAFLGVLLGGIAAALFAFGAMVVLSKPILDADEEAAKSSLKALCGAEASYKSAHGVFASSWGDLTTDPVGGPPALADPAWVDGRSVGGYVFTSVLGTKAFMFTATPETPGKTGKRVFTIDETGTITATP